MEKIIYCGKKFCKYYLNDCCDNDVVLIGEEGNCESYEEKDEGKDN